MTTEVSTEQSIAVTDELPANPFPNGIDLVMVSANNYAAKSSLGVIPLYVLPVVAGFGIALHLLVFSIIISRRLFRISSLFVFIAFISLFEIIFLSFHAVIDSVEVHLNHSVGATAFKNSKGSNLFCSIKSYGTYASGAAIEWIAITAIIYRMYGLWRPMDLLRREHPFVATNLSAVTTLITFGSFIATFWYVVIAAEPVGNGMPMTVILDCNITGDVIVWLDLALFSLVPGIVIIIVSIGLVAMFLRSRYMLRVSESAQTSPALKSAKNYVTLLLLLAVLVAICSVTVGICVLHDRIVIKYMTNGERFNILLTYMLGRIYDVCHAIYPLLAIVVSPYFRRKLFARPRQGKLIENDNMMDADFLKDPTALHY